MKTLGIIMILSLSLFACKPTLYTGSYGHVNQTQVNLSEANFNVLGSFVGTATSKKNVANIKQRTGLISDAKTNLLEQAEEAGVKLSGSRTLVNVTVDVIENSTRATATISAEIIEFK